MASVHSATVSNSPMFSATHSSVSSGATSSWTRDTLIVTSTGSAVPFGVVENERSSPGVDADELVVEVVGHPSLTDLVGPVVGVEAGHRFVVASRRQIDDDVVADGRRPVDVAERPEPLQL